MLQNEFNGYVTYDIPFGRNRMFGKNANAVVDANFGRLADESSSERSYRIPI